MKISPNLTDRAILTELGRRLAAIRIARNITQAALAEQAGVSKRTVERLESGAVAIQLSGLIRVCRVLGLMEGFDVLVPDEATSPMAQLKSQRRQRQRATSMKPAPRKAAQPWTWGDPE